MAGVSNLPSISRGKVSFGFANRETTSRVCTQKTSFLKPFQLQDEAYHMCRLFQVESKKGSHEVARRGICMALVDNRVATRQDVVKKSDVLAYDLIQGELVEWSSVASNSLPDRPTAVLLHGILGGRKNWGG
ncbi:alpha/beta hydrolase domain-containing protein 11 isoform X1, partial [Thalictrum thalictroides]